MTDEVRPEGPIGDGPIGEGPASEPPAALPELNAVEEVTEADRMQASQKNVDKMWKFARKFADKSGSFLHPQEEITEFLVIGLAKHIDDLGKPLCPCNFYDDKEKEVASSNFWICPCEEMQKWKYCH